MIAQRASSLLSISVHDLRHSCYSVINITLTPHERETPCSIHEQSARSSRTVVRPIVGQILLDRSSEALNRVLRSNHTAISM